MGDGCWWIVLGEVVDDLLCEMVYVDHEAVIALRLQLSYDNIQQRRASDRYQCLGHRIGKGLQAGAKSRCKYHCLFHKLYLRLQRYKKNRNQ